MLVVLVLAGLAVLFCVWMVSLGHGGELAVFHPDTPPTELPDAGHLTAADLMSLQLPLSLVGYHTQVVDEALYRFSTALGERDTRIAVLEQRVADLLAGRLQARQEAFARPAEPAVTEHLPEIPKTPEIPSRTPEVPAKISEIPAKTPEVPSKTAAGAWEDDRADAEESW
ncbi:hypothetical protein GCM10023194_71860 [Planotetraspora phitsanulokensis]|uniref:DivIVA domain-containing protein n=1 Tax=Planotetraspora phitsanulokensis TaxID=575192 RepID=A0A8J3U332_9ACTN|nr:hypothetical protein [Planotetraspora phitsanulokensis]GII37315.1 hypothetical protein Pph01_23180 [Planotetraspora phitsanulokensis]